MVFELQFLTAFDTSMIGMSLMRSTRQISRFLQSKRFLSQGFECEESDFFRRVLLRFPPGDSNTGTWPLAFAYGSGVFKQEGNVSKNNMTDFMLVVEDSENWHSKNLEMNPKDYSGMPLFKDKIQILCRL